MRTTEILNSNGTIFSRIHNPEHPNFSENLEELWNLWDQCRIGTPPSTFAGHWVFVESKNLVCIRLDVVPFFVLCNPFRIIQEEWVGFSSDMGDVYGIDGELIYSESSGQGFTCVRE